MQMLIFPTRSLARPVRSYPDNEEYAIKVLFILAAMAHTQQTVIHLEPTPESPPYVVLQLSLYTRLFSLWKLIHDAGQTDLLDFMNTVCVQPSESGDYFDVGY